MLQNSTGSRGPAALEICLLIALSARTSAAQNASAPSPQAGVLRVEAPSVVVDVVVEDKNGRSVKGLALTDFAVDENTVPQKIVSFTPPTPLIAREGNPSPSAGGRNARSELDQARTAQREINLPPENETLGSANLRFVTLVMDLGDLQSPNLKAACDAAQEYLRNDLAREDFVALYWIGQASLHLALPYSMDRDIAAQAISSLARRVPAGIVTASERREIKQEIAELQEKEYERQDNPPLAQAYRRQRMALQSTLWMESTYQARSVFTGLRAIAQSLAALPGRKNVVVFSEGFVHSPEAVAELAAVVDAANRANVSFYVIDASGLTLGTAADNFSAEAANPGEHLTRGERQGPPTVDTLAAEMNEMADAGPEPTFGTDKFEWSAHLIHHDPDEDLERIADDTGGVMIRNQNDLLRGLKRVDADVRQVYTLVYQPSNMRYDASFRKITVKVKRSGLHLRYRKGYWAIPPAQALRMTPAAAQLMWAAKTGSLKVAFHPPLNAAWLCSKDGSWSVPWSLEIPGRVITIAKQGGMYKTQVVIVAVAQDADGEPLGEFDRVFDLRMDEGKLQRFREETFTLTGRLSLGNEKPVRLQAVVQFSNGDSAVASRTLTPPGREAKDLQVTSLLLTNQIKKISEGKRDPSDPLQVLDYDLNLPAQARFNAGDSLTVYLGLLHPGLNPITNEPDVRLTLAVNSGTETVGNFPDERMEVSQGDPDRLDLLRQYPLESLKPGKYALEVTVEDRVREDKVTRRAEFEIR